MMRKNAIKIPPENNQKNVSQKQLKDAPKNQAKNYKKQYKNAPQKREAFYFKINSF